MTHCIPTIYILFSANSTKPLNTNCCFTFQDLECQGECHFPLERSGWNCRIWLESLKPVQSSYMTKILHFLFVFIGKNMSFSHINCHVLDRNYPRYKILRKQRTFSKAFALFWVSWWWLRFYLIISPLSKTINHLIMRWNC